MSAALSSPRQKFNPNQRTTIDMDANEQFELVARIFQLMTGLMAPGKDVPPGYSTVPEEMRNETFIEWREHFQPFIHAMLQAVDENYHNRYD